MINGYWNGEPALIEGVNYVVPTSKLPLAWNHTCVGKTRQGIIVNYEGSKFLIDNEHGEGYHKVTVGRGSWRFSHKTVSGASEVTPIPDADIKTFHDVKSIKKEREEYDQFMMKKHPDEFKRLLALRNNE